jgi:hypothetical protein
MRSTAPSHGKRKYVCPPKPDGCNGIAILADRVEEELAARVLVAIDAPGLSAAFDSADRGEDLVVAMAADESQLEELAGDWAAKLISRAEWLVARDVVHRRLDESRTLLAEQAIKSHVTFADLPGRWEDLTFDQRRAVLAAVVERVEIQPATRGRHFFDPARLHVVWRA